MNMNDVLTDEMASVFGGNAGVPDVICSGNGIVIPSRPSGTIVNLF